MFQDNSALLLSQLHFRNILRAAYFGQASRAGMTPISGGSYSVARFQPSKPFAYSQTHFIIRTKHVNSHTLTPLSFPSSCGSRTDAMGTARLGDVCAAAMAPCELGRGWQMRAPAVPGCARLCPFPTFLQSSARPISLLRQQFSRFHVMQYCVTFHDSPH